jgi:hypothetical protein
MELAGLEPAISWVRFSLTVITGIGRLQGFLCERLERRNISRNSLHRDLQGLVADRQRRQRREDAALTPSFAKGGSYDLELPSRG